MPLSITQLLSLLQFTLSSCKANPFVTMLLPVSLVYLASLIPIVSSSPQHGKSLNPRQALVPVAQFSYTGITGPLNWHALNLTANAKCAHGRNQSPININSTVPASDGSALVLKIPDYPSGAEFENLGSTVEVIVSGNLTREGKQYTLAQFHFHLPSEHRLSGEYYPMEAHFVFRAAG